MNARANMQMSAGSAQFPLEMAEKKSTEKSSRTSAGSRRQGAEEAEEAGGGQGGGKGRAAEIGQRCHVFRKWRKKWRIKGGREISPFFFVLFRFFIG